MRRVCYLPTWPQDRSPCAGHAQQLVLQAVDRKTFLVLEQLQEYITKQHVLPRPHAPPPLILGRELGSLQHTLVLQSGYVLALCCTASIDCPNTPMSHKLIYVAGDSQSVVPVANVGIGYRHGGFLDGGGEADTVILHTESRDTHLTERKEEG